jgi:hypothetical protein
MSNVNFLTISLLDFEKTILDDLEVVKFPEPLLPLQSAIDCIPSVFTHSNWYCKLLIPFARLLDSEWKPHYEGNASKLEKLYLTRLRYEDDTRYRALTRVEQFQKDNPSIGKIILESATNNRYPRLLPNTNDGRYWVMIVQMLLLRDMCRISSPQMAPQDVVPIIDKKISQLFNPEATPDIIDSSDQEEPQQSIEEGKGGPDIRKELLWSGVFPSSSK